MKTVIMSLVLSASVVSPGFAQSNCSKAYTESMQTLSKKIVFRKGELTKAIFYYGWIGASFGAFSGGVYHHATWEKQTVFEGSDFNEAYQNAYDYQEREDAARHGAMLTGAVAGFTASSISIATFGVKDYLLKKKIKDHAKVLELVHTATTFAPSDLYADILSKIQEKNPHVTEADMNEGIIEIFSDPTRGCPGYKPVTLKRFSESLERLMLAKTSK